jgi:hypothetical protein
MKIYKLYTLSGFVEHIQTEGAALEFSEGYMNYIPDEDKFEKINNYNEFLKQALTKDFFINPIDVKHVFVDCSILESARENRRQIEEAEKKVMFTLKERRISESWREYLIPKGSDWMIEWCIFDRPEQDGRTRFTIRNNEIKTLHDLAEATKGELELKNVEL